MSTPCCYVCHAVSLHALPPLMLQSVVASSPVHTESSTLLKALSSASMFSFLRCSSAKDSCAAPPLEALAVVGPEGTVGAWRLFILRGRPMSVGRSKW